MENVTEMSVIYLNVYMWMELAFFSGQKHPFQCFLLASIIIRLNHLEIQEWEWDSLPQRTSSMLKQELRGIPHITPSAKCARFFYFADRIRLVSSLEEENMVQKITLLFFSLQETGREGMSQNQMCVLLNIK